MPHAPDPVLPSTPDEAARQDADVRPLVAGVPPVFRLEALAARRWACVAVEDELTGDAAMRLAQACAAQGFTDGFSVEISSRPRAAPPAAHRFALSAIALEALRNDVHLGSCYVVAESSGRFAVATDGDYYWMLAGPRDFVEAALGLPVEAQLRRFGEAAEAYARSRSAVERRLGAIQSVAVAASAAVGA